VAAGSDIMPEHSTPGGDRGVLLSPLERIRARMQQVAGHLVKNVVIQDAGLDDCWVHRSLELNGIESHVVDAGTAVGCREIGEASRLCDIDVHVGLHREQ
jgi:transposase